MGHFLDGITVDVFYKMSKSHLNHFANIEYTTASNKFINIYIYQTRLLCFLLRLLICDKMTFTLDASYNRGMYLQITVLVLIALLLYNSNPNLEPHYFRYVNIFFYYKQPIYVQYIHICNLQFKTTVCHNWACCVYVDYA